MDIFVNMSLLFILCSVCVRSLFRFVLIIKFFYGIEVNLAPCCMLCIGQLMIPVLNLVLCLVWLYILALRSIVLVLSCVTDVGLL